MSWQQALVGIVLLPGAVGAPARAGEPPVAVGQYVIVKRPGAEAVADYRQTPPQALGRSRIAQQVVKVEGDWLWVHVPRGMGWLHRRDVFTLPEALAYYDERVRADPKDADARARRGMAHFASQDMEAAGRDLSEAIRRDPLCADAYCHRAMLAEDAHDDDRALADYSKAIELHPGHCDSYLNRAILYYRRGDYDAMIRDLTVSLPLYKDPAHAYHLRAEAWLAKQDPDKALADIGEVLRRHPGLPEALATRDKAQRMKGPPGPPPR